jgi:hypothetical protein
MRFGLRRSLGLTLGTLAWVGSACGHVPSAAPGREEEQASRNAGQQYEMVLVTGSRIPQRVDASSGLPATAWPVRIYMRRDLVATGRPQTADALRQLDPSIGTGLP